MSGGVQWGQTWTYRYRFTGYMHKPISRFSAAAIPSWPTRIGFDDCLAMGRVLYRRGARLGSCMEGALCHEVHCIMGNGHMGPQPQTPLTDRHDWKHYFRATSLARSNEATQVETTKKLFEVGNYSCVWCVNLGGGTRLFPKWFWQLSAPLSNGRVW